MRGVLVNRPGSADTPRARHRKQAPTQAQRIAAVLAVALAALSATPSAHAQTPRVDRFTACLTVGQQPAQTKTRVAFTEWTADSVKVDGKALTVGDPMAPNGFVMYGEGVVVRAGQRGRVVTVRASSVLDHSVRVCVRAHKTTALDRMGSGE